MKINFGPQVAEAKTKAAQKAKPLNLLRGTGITQRLAKQGDRDAKKIAAATTTTKLDILQGREDIHGQITIDAPQPRVLTLADHDLPDDLMGDIELDNDQMTAVAGIVKQQFAVLIGAAGTGKTTTTKALVKALERSVATIDLNRARTSRYQQDAPDWNVAVAFCAFTGRAVQQIKRALPKEYHPMCDTIHATLGYAPVEEEYFNKKENEWQIRKVFRPTFTAANKLPYKIVIVDEAGMVPVYLWNELIDALPADCRIILVGDINQLPPVQGRSVLGFAMLQWPTFALTKVHRTAEDNAIIQNAHRVLNGKMPIADKKTFFIQDMPGGSMETLRMTLGIVQKLHQKDKFDPFQDGLIVPQNKSVIGQLELNTSLVGYFNQVEYKEGIPLNPRTLIKAGYVTCNYAVGDKVMLLNNERTLGLTNGMIGIVQEITLNGKFKGEAVSTSSDITLDMDFELEALDAEIEAIGKDDPDADEKERERQASHIMKVKFQNVDDEVEFSAAGSFNKLAHAYAFTCHKSQGGEYPTVVILLHSANLRMLTREWLYTAMTRAKQKVILLCNRRGLVHAIGTQRIKGNTFEEKAQSFIKLMDATDTSLPTLPEPADMDLVQFTGNTQ